MSALQQVKGTILRGLKNEPQNVKAAFLNLFYAIDSDLDQIDYEPSEDTEICLDNLDKALIEYGEILDAQNNPEPELRKEIGSIPVDTEVELTPRKEVGNLPESITKDENTSS